MDPRFWTLLQESFNHSYLRTGVRFSEHCLLSWGALCVSADGVPILPFFEQFPGLVPLLSERAQYVREWVRIFYSTVYVEDERRFIQFMFDGAQ